MSTRNTLFISLFPARNPCWQEHFQDPKLSKPVRPSLGTDPPKTHIVAPYEIRLCKCRLPEHEIIRQPLCLLLRRCPVGQKEYPVEVPSFGTGLKA